MKFYDVDNIIHVLRVPTCVYVPRKTKAPRRVALNLNIYRNLHHYTNNQAKKIFKQLIDEDLKGLGKLLGQIEIEYELFTNNKRLVDVSNVCSIVDKFFCDALVESGVIEDDNYKHLVKVVYKWGGVRKGVTPHVVITIKSKREGASDE